MTIADESKANAAARLQVGVVCADLAYSDGLVKALTESFGTVNGGPQISTRADADILVYAFDEPDVSQPDFLARHSTGIDTDTAPTKVFLELVSSETLGARAKEIADRNTSIAQLAHDHGGYLVPLMSKFMRWDPARLMTETGALNEHGHHVIARAVAKFIGRFDVRRSLDEKGHAQNEIQTASADTILSQLKWPEQELPRMARYAPDESSTADFLDGYVSFSSYPKWGRSRLAKPVDWSAPGPNRSWQSYFLGLEFLGPSLALYVGLVSEARLRGGQVFRKLLRKRDVTASGILERASAVIADFLRANPPDAPIAQRAWHEGTVCRRVKILLAYLICCRFAREKGDPIDDATVVAAFASLKSSIELLRSDAVYIKSGNHGVRQDALIIVTALLFDGTPEFAGLLREGLDRLKRYQLDTMLTEDGVWRENSFEYHRLIMGLFGDLVYDMHIAGAGGIGILLDALARMETFAEAVVKCDGRAPLIGDTTPREALRAIVAARLLISSLHGRVETDNATTFERKEETYFFPASGYFASHSARALRHDVSSLIFYANLSAPKHKHADDLSVLFSHGGTDLLVDGGTYNKETSDDIRNAARFDPATHNTYRVNGKGYSVRGQKGKPLAGVTAQWSGDGWTAAHGFNHAYKSGMVDRFIIHLKQQNALILVDHLKSASFFLASNFEQFWHIAPQFQPTETPTTAGTLEFSSKTDGKLFVAFDDGVSTCKIEQGGPGDPLAWLMTDDDKIVPTPYIRRARRARKTVMASLFQWAPDAADLKVELSGERVTVRATGVNAVFSVSRTEVKCLRFDA